MNKALADMQKAVCLLKKTASNADDDQSDKDIAINTCYHGCINDKYNLYWNTSQEALYDIARVTHSFQDLSAEAAKDIVMTL